MAIENREKELASIYNDISDDKLVLPNFQRGFIWSREQQAKLLASVLVGLPVGSLLVLEGKSDDFSKRGLCFPAELESTKDCDYVLDGQQRLSTLRSIFFDLFADNDWKGIWDKMYGTLRTRWFLSIQPEQSDIDVFGYKDLNFDRLSKYTDSDVIDYVKSFPIRKTKTNEIHSPGYRVKKDDGTDEDRLAFIKDAISSQYAELDLVPLWEVSSKSSGLHRKVLTKIANKRINELKLDVEDSNYTLDFLERVFSPINLTTDELELKLNGLDDTDDLNDKLSDEWAALQAQWVQKVSSELEGMPSRKMAIIHLDRVEVSRAAAIFEAINRGGIPLSTYDLVVAKSARDQTVKNLSTKIIDAVEADIQIDKIIFPRYSADARESDVVWSASDMGVVVGNEPSNAFKDWFVNVLSLLVHVHTNKEECGLEHIKREKVLSLSYEQVNEHSEATVVSIVRALAFLQLRCGVITGNDISYKLMVVVLAYHLADDQVWKSKEALDKLEYWYWISLFSGTYFYSQNARCVEDIKELGLFISGKRNNFASLTSQILNLQNFVTKDILLREDDGDEERKTIIEPKSIKTALMQFTLSRNPSDFVRCENDGDGKKLSAWSAARGEPELEVHHIIPLAEATTIGESTKNLRKDSDSIMNSSLNLTYISKHANRDLSYASPADYVEVINHMANATNYLPHPDMFKKVLSDKNYKTVLENRFSLLESGIKNHIASLI